MTKIYYESDADLSVLDGQWVAVVGYGNQGRSWALNLRDSGLAVDVFTRADASRDQAETEGFTAHEIEAASECDVICTLIPDDVSPSCPSRPSPMRCGCWPRATRWPSTGSTPTATSAWSPPGCSVPRCVSATWRAWGSS